jgi:glycosyltransferase involved in cell wall biosynthesis
MIPTYNRARYLEKTLTSVLSQDPGAEEMQIEVVDDGSTLDDPEPVVRRVAGDRVSFVRHPRNLGLVPNFNCCVERSLGDWVHILHSDDYVLPGFYERLRTALATRSDVGGAFCRALFVDGEDQRLCEGELERSTPGILPDFIEKIGVSQRIVTPTIVVRRSVYEQLGGYRLDLCYTPDWQMWIRIAANYPMWYEPAALAACRLHSKSETSNLMRSRRTVADMRRCIEISRSLLPPSRAGVISRRAKELAALQALNFAWNSLAKNEFTAALSHVWEGLRCSSSPCVVKTFLLLLARVAKAVVRRPIRMVQRGHSRARA